MSPHRTVYVPAVRRAPIVLVVVATLIAISVNAVAAEELTLQETIQYLNANCNSGETYQFCMGETLRDVNGAYFSLCQGVISWHTLTYAASPEAQELAILSHVDRHPDCPGDTESSETLTAVTFFAPDVLLPGKESIGTLNLDTKKSGLGVRVDRSCKGTGSGSWQKTYSDHWQWDIRCQPGRACADKKLSLPHTIGSLMPTDEYARWGNVDQINRCERAMARALELLGASRTRKADPFE